MSEYASEMRLYDKHTRERLYLNEEERERFLIEAKKLANKKHRMLCEVLHWTGCRITEALELTPYSINLAEKAICFRTIKKRKLTKQGKLKGPVFRYVPIHDALLEQLDLVFNIRQGQRDKGAAHEYLWPNNNNHLKKKKDKTHMSREGAWHVIKRVMKAAGIEGKHATPKGFRHSYGVAMTLGGMDIYELQRRLGHEDASTTSIYLQVTGKEAHDLQMEYWEKANSNWKATG